MLKGVLRWVVDHELLLLTVVLAPLFIFPGTYTLVGLALIMGLWFGRWRAEGRVPVRLPAIDACVLVALYCALHALRMMWLAVLVLGQLVDLA